MTISLVARSQDGGFGLVITSSSPAVAARCLYVEPGVGACASQNITDPRLGTGVLGLLRGGQSAPEAIESIMARPENAEIGAYRQVTAVGSDGVAGAFSGTQALGINGHLIRDSAVIAGNMLASLGVLDAGIDAYLAGTGDLEERLLAGLAAAVAAGGEMGPVHSAGLLVAGKPEWPITNLRVDWSDAPIADLASLWERWKPQRDTYVMRAYDPAESPSYGVPGDE